MYVTGELKSMSNQIFNFYQEGFIQGFYYTGDCCGHDRMIV